MGAPEEAPPKVVNLMDALRESLERVSATKKRTARVGEAASTEAPKVAGKKRARA